LKKVTTMKKLTVRNVLVVSISLAMVNALAASASIGIATAKGSFRVDDSYVAGNATLFEGAAVETGVNSGELNLSKTRVAMGAETRGRVFDDRLILEHGKVQWTGSGFRTLVGELQVVGADSASKALVSRHGEAVQVASLSGTVNVLSTNGEMMMAVAAGSAYDFTPDPQGAAPADKEDPNGAAKKTVKKSTGAKVAARIARQWDSLITIAAVALPSAAVGVVATRAATSR
jgi:hypothetical protein